MSCMLDFHKIITISDKYSVPLWTEITTNWSNHWISWRALPKDKHLNERSHSLNPFHCYAFRDGKQTISGYAFSPNHRFPMTGQYIVNKQKCSTLYQFFCLNSKKLYLLSQENTKSKVNIDQLSSEKSSLSNLTESYMFLPCFLVFIWNVCFDNEKNNKAYKITW
jgi:hypothetical protein